MAWPKGRPRIVRPQPAPPPVPVIARGSAVADVPTDTTSDEDRMLAARRAICAHRVRLRQVPRELRIHDHMSLARYAKIIRREMAEAAAPDSEIEDRVARYVTRV